MKDNGLSMYRLVPVNLDEIHTFDPGLYAIVDGVGSTTETIGMALHVAEPTARKAVSARIRQALDDGWRSTDAFLYVAPEVTSG